MDGVKQELVIHWEETRRLRLGSLPPCLILQYGRGNCLAAAANRLRQRSESRQNADLLLERVRTRFGALSILRAGGAGDAYCAHDFTIDNERNAAFYGSCAMKREDA